MQKSRKPQHTSAGLSDRVLELARATAREFNAWAADRALADRATDIAALPRQRLSEVRALYVVASAPMNAPIQVVVPRPSTGLRRRVFEPAANQQEA